MFPSEIRQFSSQHHTFLTKRFDRDGEKRLHFSSAMTQLSYFVNEKYDGEQSQGASYLEIAEFISNCGAQTEALDLRHIGISLEQMQLEPPNLI